jgi:hypothetical protein
MTDEELIERLKSLSEIWSGYSQSEKSPTFSRGDCREFSEKFAAAADTIARLKAYRDEAYERAARILDQWVGDTPAMLLACGEMTAGELRTVKAVLHNRAAAIRNLKGSADDE